MINKGYFKRFIKKLWVWSSIVAMVLMPVSGVAAQAANWSQYAKQGITKNDRLGSFNLPVSVSVYGSNSVYVADSNNHRIQKLEVSTGEWSEWKKNGGGSGSGLGEFKNPSGVAVDSNGNVYVADTNNHRIQKWDVTTNTWRAWSKADGGSGSGLGEFKSPRGVDVDLNGNVYVADTDNHRIQKLDVSTNTWSEWGKSGGGSGTSLGQFNFPRGVAVDLGGNVYVADSRNNRIQKLDFSTVSTGEWKLIGGTLGSGVGQFKNLSDVTLDTSGNIYVADTGNQRIQKLDVSTNSWSEWKKGGGGSGSELGEFKNPYGVAVDESGEVYVADSENHRIQKLDGSAGNWSNWGYVGAVAGDSLGEFANVTGVATDDEGNLYAADYNNHRIQKLDILKGEWEEVGNGEGSGLGEFYEPHGLTVDAYGDIYIADLGNDRIQKLDITNGAWSEWSKSGGGAGSSLGEFSSPTDVAIDRNNTLYVADFGNHRIQKWVYTIPSAPIRPAATAGNGEALISFTVPSTDGGSMITGYTVTANPGGLTATGSGSPIKMTGLTNGQAYTFTVIASNRSGDSPASVATDAVTPMTYPDEPTGVTATAGNGEATVSFAAPVNDGGSAITGYTVTSNPGGVTASGTGSPIKVTDLANDTAYTFTVIAINEVGNSAASNASVAVTPVNPPNNNGGGSSPSQPIPSTVPVAGSSESYVLINGHAQSLGSAKVTKIDSQTVSTITVDQKRLAGLLAEQANLAVITIQSKASSDVVIAELNGQIIHDMESRQAVLELQTDKAIYRLPTPQIDIGAIADQIGQSVALQDIRFQIEIAVPKEPLNWIFDESGGGKVTFVVPQLDFSVRAIYLNEIIHLNEFDAYVERDIAIPAAVDASKITTGVVIEADGTLRHVPTKIGSRNGISYAKVSSLTNSVYSLIWHPLTFKDVEGHWAKQAVNDLGSRLVVKGDANGMFNPNQEVTRAEFAAILIRALGLQRNVQGTSFVDVDPDSWFAGDLGTASHYRLISGFGDGTMRPNDKMTREQAMTLLARAMILTELKEKASPAAGQALEAFTDSSAVSSWAKEGMIDSLSFGLVTGRPGNELDPGAFITRAEVAVLVQKLLSKSDLI
ncbi:S-layer homology domain-containing protein [Paenibacillus sp. KS-LC4]|uniref:S-layer homology domain-containing protein n=1 Tax=Paenibacillus sp. KS-LC4 TaxID=2979727 RepID=UPI0030D0CDF2